MAIRNDGYYIWMIMKLSCHCKGLNKGFKTRKYDSKINIKKSLEIYVVIVS